MMSVRDRLSIETLRNRFDALQNNSLISKPDSSAKEINNIVDKYLIRFDGFFGEYTNVDNS